MPSPDALIGLGTNLGDRVNNLGAALERLHQTFGLLDVSGIYETQPVGYAAQPPFLNMAARVAVTALQPPRVVLSHLRAIETALGRTPGGPRNGPRVIDLDLLVYGDVTIRELEIEVPHPRLAERAFVLVPLADIASDVVIPGLGHRVATLLRGVDDAGVRPFRRP